MEADTQAALQGTGGVEEQEDANGVLGATTVGIFKCN